MSKIALKGIADGSATITVQPPNSVTNRTLTLPDSDGTLVTEEYLNGELGAWSVGFLQSGTGAVARTMQDKGRDVVSVKDFGAVGDGVTDDTAAIQAAIDSGATSTTHAVFIPSGTYLLNSTIYIDRDRVSLFGTGPGSTVLTRNTNYGNTIEVKKNRGVIPNGTRIEHVKIENLSINSDTRITTPGSHILVQSAFICVLDNILFTKHAYRCLDLVSAASFSINRLRYYSPYGTHFGYIPPSDTAFIRIKANNDGATVYNTWTGSGVINNCNVIVYPGFGESAFYNNYCINTADGVWLSRCYGRQSLNSDYFIGSNDGYSRISGVRLTECWSDTPVQCNYEIAGVTMQAGVMFGFITLQNCQANGGSAETARSLRINNANVFGINIESCSFGYTDLAGITVPSMATGLSITNTNIYSCSSNPNTYTGCIWIGNDVTGIKIQNCVLGDGTKPGLTQNQQYGIIIGVRCDDYTIIGNTILGNSVGPMMNQSRDATNAMVANNIGYVTESQGTAPMAAGATTAVVSHKLSETPSGGDVIISKQGGAAGTSNWSVGNFTPTTFTITSATAANVLTYFSWQCRLLK